MPIKAEIITDLELLIIRAAGKIDDQSVMEFQAQIVYLPNFQPTLNIIIDARSVTDNLLSPEGVIKLSGDTPFEKSVKRAYVVADEQASIQATLLGSTSSIHKHFFVTYSIEDACEWLGISLDKINSSSVYNDN